MRELQQAWVAVVWSWGLLVNVALGQAREEPQEVDGAPARVAVVIFPGVEILDFAGPTEILSAASDESGHDCFEVYTVATTREPVDSMGAVQIVAKYSVEDAPPADVLVIPGGNINTALESAPLCAWVEQQAHRGALLFSVCNGASLLAKLGFLQGKTVATHHGNVEILQCLEPTATCAVGRRFVAQGNLVTTAGVSAGIDGALYVVAKLRGVAVARRAASGAEFDYWVGFSAPEQAIPAPDSAGLAWLPGREYHDDKDWQVLRLLQLIRTQGVDATLAAYPAMRQVAQGHDLEMIEEAGLAQTANWLLQHGRDPEIGLALHKFLAQANPKSATAHLMWAQALVAHGHLAEARQAAQQTLQIDASVREAQALLDSLGVNDGR